MSIDPAATTLALDGLGWWNPVVGGILAFAEAMFGVGALLPGEVAISTLAVAGSHDPVLVLGAAAGAVAGDHVNYALGRRLGDRLTQSRLVRWIGTRHWDRAADLLARHGAVALVLSRLLPVVRTLMPAAAGVVRLPYRTFVLASVVGSTLWSMLWVFAGSLAAELFGPRALLAVVAIAAAALVLATARRRRTAAASLLAERPVARVAPCP